MGVVKNLLGPVGKILGGGLAAGAAKSGASTPTPQKADATPVDAEEERRRRIVSLNGGASSGQMTAAGGDTSKAATGRKMLLGL